MTISPPANVKLAPGEAARVLSWGVDTLVSTVDVTWESEEFFDVLGDLKSQAKTSGEEATGKIEIAAKGDKGETAPAPFLFTVKPHGADGYEWLLASQIASASVGHWREPKSRPSMIFRIASEALWTHTPKACVDRVLQVVNAAQGIPDVPKMSRVDVCVDVLIREADWGLKVHDQIVCRALDIGIFSHRRLVSGYQIGKGDYVARLYDKPLEIKNQSNKLWMYDIWKVKTIPKDHRIIRVEFQLRREAIKEQNLDTVDEVLAALPSIWQYCTQNWLRIVDDPREHHTMQTVLPWWEVVQAGVTGALEAHPLVRAKAVSNDERILKAQLQGTVAALVGLKRQGKIIQPDEVLDTDSHVREVIAETLRDKITDEEFTERVKRTQAKKARATQKFRAARGEGQSLARSRLRRRIHKPKLPAEGGSAPKNESTIRADQNEL